MKKQQKIEALFDEMIAGIDAGDIIPYAANTCFKDGDIIDHPKFGVGKVLSCITPNKMQVQFREGERILVCVLSNGKD
ncbi:MAG: hypothetical protein GXP59_06815 [Deltaproteobacteria bacterium]|nr:hypothetical protein [Deltaproteobacteria bacterium]